MTAAADSSGKAYTWGCGGSKRLGHGSSNNEMVPRVLQPLASVFVTRVTCGHMHVAVVTSVGSIFTWGDGEFGKLGHGDFTCTAHSPACPPLPYALHTPGNVESVSVPTFCRLMRDIACDVACGKDHTLALTSTGGLLAWGCNKDGRLGLGHTQTLYEPNRSRLPRAHVSYAISQCLRSVPLQGMAASCVSAGWDHSSAVIDGRAYTWGRGVKGQLGDGEGQSKKQVMTQFFKPKEPNDCAAIPGACVG